MGFEEQNLSTNYSISEWQEWKKNNCLIFFKKKKNSKKKIKKI